MWHLWSKLALPRAADWIRWPSKVPSNLNHPADQWSRKPCHPLQSWERRLASPKLSSPLPIGPGHAWLHGHWQRRAAAESRGRGACDSIWEPWGAGEWGRRCEPGLGGAKGISRAASSSTNSRLAGCRAINLWLGAGGTAGCPWAWDWLPATEGRTLLVTGKWRHYPA